MTCLGFALITAALPPKLSAQETAAVYAQNEEIGRNLDLEAVASIFGESSDLSDFERRLNDPRLQISNLDLNRDGKVDYLRVVEATEGDDVHLVVIQAVVGYDTYQDVATIEVERHHGNHTVVQVVGNPYMYGPDYIIEPVYIVAPPIYDCFWGYAGGAFFYHAYHSPYRWGYYPPHFHPWHPRPAHRYFGHVRRYINGRNYYNRGYHRRNLRASHIHNRVRRDDYITAYDTYRYRKHRNRRRLQEPVRNGQNMTLRHQGPAAGERRTGTLKKHPVTGRPSNRISGEARHGSSFDLGQRHRNAHRIRYRHHTAQTVQRHNAPRAGTSRNRMSDPRANRSR